MTNHAFPPIEPGRARRLAPTDVAQFIRLDQCQRYLRLRLHERAFGQRFMREYGVVPQSIPAILTRSGAEFEQQTEAAIAKHWPAIDAAAGQRGTRTPDNERVVEWARGLPAGNVLVLFQPRLETELGGWLLRGDLDILRLERDLSGRLHVLIADMKATTTAKIEHRLQIAFYLEMLSALFAEARIEYAGMQMGVLYRGPAAGEDGLSPADLDEMRQQREASEQVFGTRDALLELEADAESFRESVRDLVTNPDSTAARVAVAGFNDVPFHLSYKCDGCLYNEFCLKWSAEHDDLSLVPHITAEEKSALQRAGIQSVKQLAELKELPVTNGSSGQRSELAPNPAFEPLVRQLSATWPVGPHLDELVMRARRYRKFKGDSIESRSYIPGKGYESLPYSDAEQNPNLVRVYIDAQHDYLQDRIYLAGALVVASERGVEAPHRRRTLVHLTDGPPDSPEAERALLVRFVDDLIGAVVELAAPDAQGEPRAPIHLIFYNSYEQRVLLDALARHFDAILGATPLYDFVTQIAAFDSPIASYLDQEIRAHKNYPMLCQSLQAVAAYLKFNWNEPEPYREVFRARMFDFWGKFDAPPREENPWYTSRARFSSQIPLEYAYAAWNVLETPSEGQDDFSAFRQATPDLLRGFQVRRLAALERVAHDFSGNRQSTKASYDLPDLARFQSRAGNLAAALDEFVVIERHVELSAWKSSRQAPPERRVLAGESLIVRYLEADQAPEVVERNRENMARYHLRQRYDQEWRAAHPDGARPSLSREQREETKWEQKGMRFRLRLRADGVDCDLDEVLGLSTFRPGDVLVLFERTTVDSRLPKDQQTPFTPTPRQMLYGPRVDFVGLTVERDSDGRAVEALAEVEMRGGGGKAPRGFAFATFGERPLVPGETYTLDTDPNDWYGAFCAGVTAELCEREATSPGGHNTVYDRLTDLESASVLWPPAAEQGQQRFLEGLERIGAAGHLHPFEDRQRQYIGQHGADAVLLVQGPPGTGKSYSTAFALFARLQGALAAGLDFRVFLTCKTHAATNVLLRAVVEVQGVLRRLQVEAPELFPAYIDARLLEIPLFRAMPNEALPGVQVLHRKDGRPKDERIAAETILGERHCVVGVTPGGIYRLLKDRWDKDLFGHGLCHCLVLDEASQLNLAEAVLAGLALTPDGHLVVVGDHRQMPPIVKHNWDQERRRTFQQFRSYESLFRTLFDLGPPLVQFAESFRLHADMAAFLRREVYEKDGIPYFSRKHPAFLAPPPGDAFVAAVLSPDHPIVVVVHDEAASMLRNPFEQALIVPVLETLSREPYCLDPRQGLGVVVPHRAQRAALLEALPALSEVDPRTGALTLTAVDTVERFQGDERMCILVSATESDEAYLLLSQQFLLDPRRLTVALSRAKAKMILVASRSIFGLFSPDEETFAHAQLWKNLLRRTCTVRLWEGQREGRAVTVWGNMAGGEREAPADAPEFASSSGRIL